MVNPWKFNRKFYFLNRKKAFSVLKLWSIVEYLATECKWSLSKVIAQYIIISQMLDHHLAHSKTYHRHPKNHTLERRLVCLNFSMRKIVIHANNNHLLHYSSVVNQFKQIAYLESSLQTKRNNSLFNYLGKMLLLTPLLINWPT